MNLYFIVEGRRTEKRVYPVWLSHLLPGLTRVRWAFEATENSYYLFNGNGYPALLHNHLRNSVDEVNELGVFNYLVLILDVDESTVSERIVEVNQFMAKEKLNLVDAELIVIPQNRCIETWFLGNRKIFKSNPQNPELLQFTQFFNVKKYDPELMGIYESYRTHAQFHSEYCHLFLRERNIQYTKNNPWGVTEPSYLENLIDRINNSTHLNSFRTFIEFCNKIEKEM